MGEKIAEGIPDELIHDPKVIEDKPIYILDAVSTDVDRHFVKAGCILCNCLHMEYWKARAIQSTPDINASLYLYPQSS
jgi:hypothetical protein